MNKTQKHLLILTGFAAIITFATADLNFESWSEYLDWYIPYAAIVLLIALIILVWYKLVKK